LREAGNEIRLTFDYRSLADAVPPEQMKTHMQAMDRLDDALSFVVSSDLTSADAPEDGLAPLESPLAVGGIVLAAAGALAVVAGVRTRRRRRAADAVK
jgi:hypothetical protein